MMLPFLFIAAVALSTMSSAADECVVVEVPTPMRTGVLCHGFNMQASDVDRVIWGDEPRNALGRAPKAALLALQLDAELILFGTGASHSAAGVVEAEYARQMISRDPLRLRAFRGHFDSFSDKQLLALSGKCDVELASRNTVQEIHNAAIVFAQRGLTRMVLVSSNTHAPRCLRDATVVLAQLRDDATRSAAERGAFASLLQNLIVSPSDVPYWNTTPAMVQIVEPPHRPDTLVSFDTHVARMFRVPRDKHAQLAAQLDALLKHFNV